MDLNRINGLFGTAIVLYFVIALEVLIMISPFAAFFYAAFNPVLLWFAHWPATRWLAAFFLPHMVLPPGLFLKTVRVAGSVMFVCGAAIFLVCAGQVYFRKFFRRDPALGGLYRWIRHPQYLIKKEAANIVERLGLFQLRKHPQIRMGRRPSAGRNCAADPRTDRWESFFCGRNQQRAG
ncbi:MAG: hypothetical protein WBV95_04360 [Desulfobacterales bacterium]